MKIRTLIVRSLLAVVSLLFLLTTFATKVAADLYVSDSEAGKVYHYTPDGVRHVFASISQPQCMTFDAANNLYVASYNQSTIYKIRPDGRKSIFASGDEVANAVALDFDTAGDLFLSQGTFHPGVEDIYGKGLNKYYIPFNSIGGIALGPADYIYATDIKNAEIWQIAPGGNYEFYAKGFGYPGRLAFDSIGNLFTADTNAGLIYKIAPGGHETVFAAVPYPVGLIVDHSGYLFVASSYNGDGSILEFAPDGTRSTFDAGLQSPTDLAVPNSQ